MFSDSKKATERHLIADLIEEYNGPNKGARPNANYTFDF